MICLQNTTWIPAYQVLPTLLRAIYLYAAFSSCGCISNMFSKPLLKLLRVCVRRFHKQIGALLWRHNGLDGISNHQLHECLLNRSFGRRSKKTSKLRATGLCAGNSPETGEFPTQMASNAENVSIRWRHHGTHIHPCPTFRQSMPTITIEAAESDRRHRDPNPVFQYDKPMNYISIETSGRNLSMRTSHSYDFKAISCKTDGAWLIKYQWICI